VSFSALITSYNSILTSDERVVTYYVTTKHVYLPAIIPITSGSNTVVLTSPISATTGSISTTGGIAPFNPTCFCNVSVDQSYDITQYKPRNVRLNKSIYNTYYRFNLEWNLDNDTFLAYFNVFQGRTNDTDEAVVTKTKDQMLPVSVNPSSGKVYFTIQSVLLDGTTSDLSEQLVYDSTFRVAAYGKINTLGQNDIVIVDSLSSGTLRNADTTSGGLLLGNYFMFSPDGEYFAWVSNGTTTSKISLKIAHTSGNTTGVDMTSTTIGNGTKVYTFGFSRDSKKVWFVCDCGAVSGLSLSLYVMDVTGLNTVLIRDIGYTGSSNGVLAGTRTALTPQFTQDGSRIVWAEARSNITNAISLNIAASDGTGSVTELATSTSTQLANFKISEDDQYVIYVAQNTTLIAHEIFSVKLTRPGTSVKLNPLVSINEDVNAVFHITPQSDAVIFSIDNVTVVPHTTDYFSSPIYSHDPVKLTDEIQTISISANRYNPISPDGTWLAIFASNDSLSCNMYLAPTRGFNGVIKITNDTVLSVCDFGDFRWSPTGSHIIAKMFYNSSNVRLYSIDVSNGNTYMIGSTPPAGLGDVQEFYISDDGNTVIYYADERVSSRHEVYTTFARASGDSTLLVGAVASGDVTAVAISSISSINARQNE
jgi:hypothetical protein